MATGTIVLQSVCAGGDHVTIRLTVGAQTFDNTYNVDELRNAISADEIRAATSIITRFHCQGMTKAQAKTELQSPGIAVSTS